MELFEIILLGVDEQMKNVMEQMEASGILILK
jgi:hypothetical protein